MTVDVSGTDTGDGGVEVGRAGDGKAARAVDGPAGPVGSNGRAPERLGAAYTRGAADRRGPASGASDERASDSAVGRKVDSLPGETPGSRPARPPRSRLGGIALVTTVLAFVPLAKLVFDAGTGGLGVEPVERLIRRTGWWALTLLVATLAVTPVRRLTGWNRLIQVRKPLGLMAFLYASLHLLSYVVIDQFFGFSYILEDILERPFITAGFTTFVLLVPLALTSRRDSIRRLGGKRWRRIHRLIYPAGLLGVLHYYWLVKADTRPPLAYAAIVVVLLLLRLPLATRARH